MSGMYATYHGEDGLRQISSTIHNQAIQVAEKLNSYGWELIYSNFFDTICIRCSPAEKEIIKDRCEAKEINFWFDENHVLVSLDETCNLQDLRDICSIFGPKGSAISEKYFVPDELKRTSSYLEHQVFQQYHTETKLMRYIKGLENKDLSLVHSMIPLGSCTMKLNAATQLLPVSYARFAHIHPFAPMEQTKGYHYIFGELEKYLCSITGFTGCSLQPNSGAQGELAGLLVIRAYHESRNETHRDIAIIPSSAHGTNPASAVMAGMKVMVTKCNDDGNIDLHDLKSKIEDYKDRIAALMVTYPSTHGVFETDIREVCSMIHENGGLVYMDGANMNAQVGYTSPHHIGADVCHLNLHKTFAIPHGGGGPGMGPICVNDKLKPFLPNHVHASCGGENGISAVSAAPWSSASILLISYAYIRLLGADGLKKSTAYAILNANYMKCKLEKEFNVLYVGEKGRSAHELIIDLRQFKVLEITAEDIAKRLIDYGFHSPTLSFPVAGTIMIEPTESESKDEMDRFCDALIAIKKEIDEIARGDCSSENNVLRNAPHTLSEVTSDDWPYPYSREKAAYPLPYLRERSKFWASVSRVDNAYGDRNLVCTCPPIEDYVELD